jgi:hypothetical protein
MATHQTIGLNRLEIRCKQTFMSSNRPFVCSSCSIFPPDEPLGVPIKGLRAAHKHSRAAIHGAGATDKGSGVTATGGIAMVNQWGTEGKWLVHCHSGRRSGQKSGNTPDN